MRKLKAILIAASMLSVAFVTSGAPALAACGDVDGNGAINILDITYLIKFLYKGGPPPPNPADADIDGSGNLNMLDITRLINSLYKDGLPLLCAPPPFDFPNKAGSYWKYIRYNYLNGVMDTVIITADADGNFVYDYGGDSTEVQAISINGNIVHAGPVIDWQWCIGLEYYFPLQVGAQWQEFQTCGQYSLDYWADYSVAELVTVDVPAGSFTSAYHITSDWGSGEVISPDSKFGQRDEWFLPGIGTIKLQILQLNYPQSPERTVDQIWFLYEFSIAP